MRKVSAGNPLWTRDFTIITLGSVVSMLGNSLSGFAMSLFVLDYTDNPFLYAVYIAVFTIPQVVVPILAGAYLDRFSRKKTIYTLDFFSAVFYILLGLLLKSGWFNFVVFALITFILGSVQSIYMVAFESFYPLLITEGNFQKAYSISAVLETLTSLMTPVSVLLYNSIGIGALMLINSVCFMTAAIMETQIKAEEHYIEKRQEEASDKKGMFQDIKEGFQYLAAERGLMAIAVYFMFSALAGGAQSVIVLPYFRDTFENGEMIYTLIWAAAVVGRAIGGLIHYKVKLPAKTRYWVALAVYFLISIIEGFYLYARSFTVMAVMLFCTGIMGVTSYTIRASSTQAYVPDEKKGRFNGAFNVLSFSGNFVAELLAGALILNYDPRHVLTAFLMVNALAALVLIGGNAKHVKEIYNTQK